MFLKYEGIADINMLGKSVTSIPFSMNGMEWKFVEVSNVDNFRINVRTKSMLSITSSTESCFIQIMFSITKFIRLII